MDDAQRKVVVVTGGTYGIGRAISIKLATAGHAVVAFGLEAPQIGSVAAGGQAGTAAELDALGLSADLLEADVSKRADVQAVVDYVVNKYHRIDGLVNNAAIHPSGTVLNTTDEVWEKVIAVNLTGMFVCTQLVVPHMIESGGGAIVNLGSAAGWGRPNLFAYCASKGGVFGLSSALAYDLKRYHVRVNVVVPGGWVLSGMTQRTQEDAERAAAAAQDAVAGRNVMPMDVAHAVNYLLSDEAEQVTGAILNVGGFVMQAGGGSHSRAADS